MAVHRNAFWGFALALALVPVAGFAQSEEMLAPNPPSEPAPTPAAAQPSSTQPSGPAIPTPANPDQPRDHSAVDDGSDDDSDTDSDTDTDTARPEPPARQRPQGHIGPQPDLPRRPGDPDILRMPGFTGAWFYRPRGGTRRGRVLVYLHARNADPRESCRTFHSIASHYGWLVCPIGPVDLGGGHREWRNNSDYANRETIAAIDALYARFPRRVRRHDNVVMGFSEGAYVGMIVGLLNPATFPRWFIMAADDRYIDSQSELIRRAANSVQRVYFLTGQSDSVVQHTQRAFDALSRVWGPRHIRMRVLENAGHELPPNFVRTVRRVLAWVTADRPEHAPARTTIVSQR